MRKIRNIFISVIVAIAVLILLDIIAYIFYINAPVVIGWFTGVSYYETMNWLTSIDKVVDSDLKDCKTLELENEIKYLKNRIDNLKSDLTTEKCMKVK